MLVIFFSTRIEKKLQCSSVFLTNLIRFFMMGNKLLKLVIFFIEK